MLRSFFERIKSGLRKTRDLFGGIVSLFRIKGKVDEDFLAKLQERLYLADVGFAATEDIVNQVRTAFHNRDVGEDVEQFVKDKLAQMVAPGDPVSNPDGVTVILVAGVNGSGKTTSIAKLASFYVKQGKKVIVAAGDTFRAAAVEQLTIWSKRIGCEIVNGNPGADPAGVAHDACEKAKARKADILIVDTAGRLHTQTNLMAQLQKIHRVIGKQIPGAPHEVLLVLDATAGQNAVLQAEAFKRTVHCSGIILAKLDGTAKGGAIFSIKKKLDLPVKYIGVGETLDDLERFDPTTYVQALFDAE